MEVEDEEEDAQFEMRVHPESGGLVRVAVQPATPQKVNEGKASQ